MKFQKVDLTDKSNLKFECFEARRDSRPYLNLIFLKVSGQYRHGSEGKADCYFIKNVMLQASDCFCPSGMVVDFRELEYEWGDDIEMLFDCPNYLKEVAFILGPKCQPALASLLLYDENAPLIDEKLFFNCEKSAIASIKKRVVASWNERNQNSRLKRFD